MARIGAGLKTPGLLFLVLASALAAKAEPRPGSEGLKSPFIQSRLCRMDLEYDSSEVTLDSTIVPVAARERQTVPAVACIDSQYMVVWHDDRYEDRIFGARVEPPFRVADSVGLSFPQSDYWANNPSISGAASQYLVVWTENSGGVGSVCAARVGMDEGLLDTCQIVLGDRAATEATPSAFDGSNYLAVWSGRPAGSHGMDVIGCRVSTDGRVLDPTGLPLDTSDGDQVEPALAFGDSLSLVVWTSGGDVCGRLVARDGVGRGQATQISRGLESETEPAVAWDGSMYLVVWTIDRLADRDIWAARVTADGRVLDTLGFAVSDAAGDQVNPSVCYDGWNFAVVWEDYRSDSNPNVRLTRVARSGDVLDPLGIEVGADSVVRFSPSIASPGRGSVVVWHQGPVDSSDVLGARVSQAGMVETTDVLVSRSAQQQARPAVACSQDGYLATWSDYREGDGSTADIYARRIGPDGRPLDSSGFPVVAAPGNQDWSDVASNGTDYLAVWDDARSDSTKVYGARVDRSGVVLDSGGFRLSYTPGYQNHPAVAYDGSSYFVVWDDLRNGNRDIFGARLTHEGVILDTLGIAICTDSESQRYAAVGSNGTDWLVVWRASNSGPRMDIYGSRVSRAGVVLDTLLICGAEDGQWDPALASDGANWLVAWEDRREPRVIRGALVGATGTLVDSFAVDYTGRFQNSPAVVFDGADYQVIWDGVGIEGATVSRTGRKVQQYVLSDRRSTTHGPAAVLGPGGSCLVLFSAYTDFDETRPYHSERMWCLPDAVPGINDGPTRPICGSRLCATIVRGSLLLQSPPPSTHYSLLSTDGRKVADLKPGANDVRHLAPGVYFVREHSAFSGQYSGRDAPRVTKVLLAR